jgi:hypothetical protein
MRETPKARSSTPFTRRGAVVVPCSISAILQTSHFWGEQGVSSDVGGDHYRGVRESTSAGCCADRCGHQGIAARRRFKSKPFVDRGSPTNSTSEKMTEVALAGDDESRPQARPQRRRNSPPEANRVAKISVKSVVGVTGFEPATPTSRT